MSERRYRAYPKYKDSGLEWLAEIPEGWEVKRLRYVSDSNPAPSEARGLPGDTEVSFVPMEAVGERGDLALDTTKLLSDVTAGYTYFRNGDVIIAKITPCFENGKGALASGLANGIAFGTTELHVLRTHPALDQRFALYITLSDAFRRIGEGDMYGAGGQKRISESYVRNFSIGLPALPEQRAIATFLERETARIDTLVARKQRLITLLQERRTALIIRAVTKGLDPAAPMKDSGVEWLGEIPARWEVRRLKECVERLDSGGTPESDNPSYWTDDDSGTPWVAISDMTKSFLINETAKRLTADGLRSKRLPILPPGTLLYSMYASLGKVALLATAAVVNQAILGIVTHPSLLSRDFLRWWLEFMQGHVEMLSSSSTQDNLSAERVRAMPVLLPALKEQAEITQYLESETNELNALVNHIRAAITRLYELRTALISAAVTGRIDVREASQ